MAVDDEAQSDPVTVPDSVRLLQRVDAEIAAARRGRARQRQLAVRLAAVTPEAVARIETRESSVVRLMRARRTAAARLRPRSAGEANSS